MKEHYTKWMSELEKVGSESRLGYFTEEDSMPMSIQLNGFSDASSYAYAAAVYMRIEQENSIRLALVASKTKVVPLGGQTKPRLELLGAIILARLVKHVADAPSETVKIDKTCCWVDSTAVLYWILSEAKQWKQFVQNRILQIRSLVSPDCWNCCPTDANPTDLHSRGMKASDLPAREKWWSGPTFFSLPKDQWPTRLDTSSIDENVVHEKKAEFKKEVMPTSTNFVSETTISLSECIGLERFSDTRKLYQVTAYVMRFISRLKAKVKNTRGSQNPSNESLGQGVGRCGTAVATRSAEAHGI